MRGWTSKWGRGGACARSRPESTRSASAFSGVHSPRFRMAPGSPRRRAGARPSTTLALLWPRGQVRKLRAASMPAVLRTHFRATPGAVSCLFAVPCRADVVATAFASGLGGSLPSLGTLAKSQAHVQACGHKAGPLAAARRALRESGVRCDGGGGSWRGPPPGRPPTHGRLWEWQSTVTAPPAAPPRRQAQARGAPDGAARSGAPDVVLRVRVAG